MNDRINKTSICSIVFLDIVDYSKKSDSDQIDVKTKFNDLISNSLKSVAQNDRIILDTGDGVAIALMGSPEDAMFVALTIRDGILKSNVNNSIPLYVRFGINLGPVRTVIDINNQPNIIGDGINVAQRIMSFAEPNQILVSRSYYEVTSRLTLEFSEMFAYSGVKHDKHVREHEIYSVRSHAGQEVNTNQPQATKDARRSTDQLALKNKVNWKYAAPGLFAVVALLGFAKLMPTQAESVTPTVVTEQNKAKVNLAESNKPVKVALIVSEKINNLPQSDVNAKSGAKAMDSSQEANELTIQDKFKEDKLAQEKLAKSKLAAKKAKQIERKKPVESTVAVNVTHKAKSGMEAFANSFKQGQKNECSQAQISMNQCH
ncbi:MAG: adenylate/guanylate cyclase domain-containing protein [Methylotenera sp.]